MISCAPRLRACSMSLPTAVWRRLRLPAALAIALRGTSGWARHARCYESHVQQGIYFVGCACFAYN